MTIWIVEEKKKNSRLWCPRFGGYVNLTKKEGNDDLKEVRNFENDLDVEFRLSKYDSVKK